MAKVVAFNGSPRKDGNTSILIGHMFEELENEGIATELVQVGKKKIRGCTACMKCFENKDGHCVFDDDIINRCIDQMVEADGIILGSPVYFLDVTAEMKGLIDRAGLVSIANGGCTAAGWVWPSPRSGGPGAAVRLTPCFTSCSPGVWLSRDSLSSGLGGRSGT